MKKVFFCIHEYDSDGDVIEHGIFICLENVRLKIGTNVDEFKNFVKEIQDMIPEIEETFTHAKR